MQSSKGCYRCPLEKQLLNLKQNLKLLKKKKNIRKERGGNVVELDQFKTIMNAYEEPLAEMRDSL